MTSDTFLDGQDANAQNDTLPRYRHETQPMAEPLSPTDSDAVIRTLADHHLPAACVPRPGQEGTSAFPQGGVRRTAGEAHHGTRRAKDRPRVPRLPVGAGRH